MIFVIGGSYQGKLEYVKKTYGLSDELIRENCLYGFHAWVRQAMEEGQTVEEMEQTVRDWLDTNRYGYIISNEVGYGIVPIKQDEEAYRELVGRLSCMLAQQAEHVIRVVAGVGCVIK